MMKWFTNKMIFNSLLGLSLFYFTGRWFSWFRLTNNNQKNANQKKMESSKKKLLCEDEYKESALRRFLASYCEVNDHAEKYNTNVESIFYLRALYLEALKDPDNELEKTWKRRILMESTPRGNIVMYYDAFKRAFSYYSDNSMPYSLLNAVCMKYVLMYRCRDLFIDQYVIPSGFPTTFHKIHFDDEVDTDKEKKKVEIKQLVSKGPFLKPKKDVIIPISKVVIAPTPVLDLVKNKIIRVGRLSNFQPLIKEKGKGKNQSKEKSLDNEFVVVKSYSDFKQWRTPTNVATMFE